MYIQSLHINSFAGLEDFDLELSPGLNILEGGNESGKSTVASFIKFMLYGASPKERELFVSWRTGGAAGTLTFVADGGRYRLERALVGLGVDGKLQWRETVRFIDLATGMTIHKGEIPGELIFGVDAELFKATAFVSQLGGAEPDRARLAEGIENLLFSADESVNTQRALAKLDSARVALLHKNEKGGRLYELDSQIAELECRLSSSLKLSDEIRTKEAQLADLRIGEVAAREKGERLTEKVRQFETRSLIVLFDRLHAIETKIAALSSKKAAPNEKSASLRALSERLRQLDDQLDELESRRVRPAEFTEEMRRFERLGGRDGIESKRHELKSARSLMTLLAVPLLFIGAIVLWFWFGGLNNDFRPFYIPIAGVAIVAATLLLIAAAMKGKRLSELISGDELDRIEQEYDARSSQIAAAQWSELSIRDLESRLASATEEAERLVGHRNGLPALLTALEEASLASDEQSVELSKYRSMLESMQAQLAGCDESELRAALDESVSLDGIDATNLAALKREASFETRRALSQERMAAELEKTLAGLYPTTEDSSKLSDRLGAARLERERLAKRLTALKLAHEKLSSASSQLRSSVAPRLAAESSAILERVTGGKYVELGLGESLEASLATDLGQRSAALMSAGTQDAIYLALRLALCRTVYRLERPPLICDESFVRLDAERTKRLLELLTDEEQVLVTTSSDREAKLASGANVVRL